MVVFVVVVSAIAATASYFFQLLVAFVRLPAFFPVALHCIPQPRFRPVNVPFTSFVSFVSFVRARLQGRTDQADHCQQGNT